MFPQNANCFLLCLEWATTPWQQSGVLGSDMAKLLWTQTQYDWRPEFLVNIQSLRTTGAVKWFASSPELGRMVVLADLMTTTHCWTWPLRFVNRSVRYAISVPSLATAQLVGSS